MRRLIILTTLVLIPYVGTSQVVTDSLTCFTPTQLKSIVRDIEKGELYKKQMRLKEEQISNLQAQMIAIEKKYTDEAQVTRLKTRRKNRRHRWNLVVSFCGGVGLTTILVLL